jgi:site-specific recombinase XerD
MATVYSGKIAIPAEKIDEYLEILKEAEKRREPFKQQLTHLNEDFNQYLSLKFTEKTANKHSGIVHVFIDFICGYTDVEDINDITKGMVNTHFKQWWKRKVWDSTTPDQLRVALKKFFTFLAMEKGIVNDKVLKALS